MDNSTLTFDDLPEASASQGGGQSKDTISFDDLPVQTKPEDRRDPETGVPGGNAKQEKLKAGYKADLTKYGMGKADELPRPSTAMYDSFPRNEGGYKEALKLYEAYTKHKDSGVGLLGTTYKNTYVPAPRPSDFKEDGSMVGDVMSGDVGLKTLTKPLVSGVIADNIPDSDNVIGGISNAGRNLLISASGTLDLVAEKITGQKGGLTQYLDENVPEWNAEGGVDEFVTIGTEVAMGAVAGGSLGLANKALAATAIAAGSALAVDDETPTIAVGDNAIMKIFNGIPLGDDVDPSYAQEVMERKINLVTEALVAEGVVNSTSKAVMFVGSLIKHSIAVPLGNFVKAVQGDVKGIEALQVQSLLDALSVDVSDKNAVESIRNIIRDNKSVEMDLGIGGKETATIDRTTMGAVKEGMDTDVSLELEAGQRQKGSPQLTKKLGQPEEEMSDIQSAANKEFGGVQTAQQAGDEIADVGIRDVASAREQAKAMTEAFEQAEQAFVDELTQNPELGSTIQRLSDASGVDIFAREAQTTAENSMINRVKNAIVSLTKKKNDLYNAIPDDVEFDVESFSAALEEANEYIPKNIRSMITEDIDFKTLHNKIVPELSRSIGILMSRNQVDEEAVSALVNLRKNIYEDQIDYLINSGDPDVARIAEEAKAFYKDVYAPLSKSEPLDVLFEIHDMTTPRVSFEQKALDKINSEVKETRRFNTDQFVRLLKTTGDPEDLKSLSDVVIGRTISKIRNKFSSQNISDINTTDLVNMIQEEAGMLSREFPEIAESFDNLVKQIEGKKLNLTQREKLLDEFVENAREREQDILKGTVGKFLNVAAGSKAVTKGKDGYQVLSRDFFSDKVDGLEKVSELVDLAKAEDNPLIMEGLKGGYFKHLQDGMFKENTFQAARARELLDPTSPFFKMGKKIFEDNPEIIDRIHDILVVGYNETAKRQRVSKLALINPNSFGNDASAATNIVVTQVFGVLNRLGARVRSAASAGLKRFDPSDTASAIADEIFANPDYAIELLNREIDNFSKGTFRPEVSREMKLFIMKALGRTAAAEGKAMTKDEEMTFLQEWNMLEAKMLEEQKTNDQTDMMLSPDPGVWGKK